MKSLLIKFIFIFICSCKFTHSPYEVGYSKIRQNESNLAVIQREESSTGNDYKIAFISDTHNYYEDMNDLVETINKNGPYSFVVVTGDVTNYGLLEEYRKTKDLLDDLQFPYLVLPGNHDLLSNGEKIFKNMFGDLNFNLVYKDLEFVFLNNNNWESSGPIMDALFAEQTLIGSSAPFKILVAHVSPTDQARFTTPEIKFWQNLVVAFDIKYFIHGHNHNPVIGNLSTAFLITVGAPSKRSYFELIFSSGGLSHKKINF